jgi:hypothetical protein
MLPLVYEFQAFSVLMGVKHLWARKPPIILEIALSLKKETTLARSPCDWPFQGC